MALFKRYLHSRSEARKRQRRRLRLSLFGIISIAVLLFGVAWLSYRPGLSVTNVAVSGNSLITDASLRAIAEEELAGTYLRFFNKRNAFLYPDERIRSELMKNFPRLAAATVVRTSLTDIAISVRERTPSVLVCKENALASQCHFADKNGLIFAPAPMFTGYVYFTVYGEPRGGRIAYLADAEGVTGRFVLPQESWDRVERFRSELTDAGMEPVALRLHEYGDLAFQYANGVALYFNEKQDLTTVMHNLLSAFDTDALARSDITGEEPTITYVDLRFGDRIFVK